MMEHDRLFVEFVYYFNEQRHYYYCHEVMEELWMEEARSPLYQGLLQVAVGLFHCQRDNFRGALKSFTAANQKLSVYPETILGIDLEKLRNDTEQYIGKLQNKENIPFDFYHLSIEVMDEALQKQVEYLIEHPPLPPE